MNNKDLTFLIFPCEEIPGQWTAICLEYNIWSTGRSIQNARIMIAEAVTFSFEDCDPCTFEEADQEFWDLAIEVNKSKKPLEGVTFLAYLCKIEGKWQVRDHNKYKQLRDMSLIGDVDERKEAKEKLKLIAEPIKLKPRNDCDALDVFEDAITLARYGPRSIVLNNVWIVVFNDDRPEFIVKLLSRHYFVKLKSINRKAILDEH